MKSYDNFILEAKLWKGTQELSIDVAIKIIKEKCSKFSFDDKPIMRQVTLRGKWFKVDPTKQKRKSSQLSDIHSLIMNKTWKNWPSRNYSVICRINNNNSTEIGNYRVIPFDDSKWGVCGNSDIWWDWNRRIEEKYNNKISNSRIIRCFEEIIKTLYDRKINDDNYDDLIKDIDLIDDFLLTYSENDEINRNTKGYIEEIKEILKEQNLTFKELLFDLYSPGDDFSLKSYDELQDTMFQNFEIWSESKCVLIHYEFENELKEKFHLYFK